MFAKKICNLCVGVEYADFGFARSLHVTFSMMSSQKLSFWINFVAQRKYSGSYQAVKSSIINVDSQEYWFHQLLHAATSCHRPILVVDNHQIGPIMLPPPSI
jgi:hypothetical protein